MSEKTPIDELHIDDSFIPCFRGKKTTCLVDGEHYPPVTKATLEVLTKNGADIVALVFLGGTEKIKDPVNELMPEKEESEYTIYSCQGKKELPNLVKRSLIEERPDIVVDLSDEPVVDYEDRFEMASVILKYHASYIGSDFIFQAPQEKKVLSKPSLSIIGTGKRVGKTGVSVSIARTMKEDGYEPVIVCMGRGGPPEPVVVEAKKDRVNADFLLKIAESGKHAASDYLEDALLAEVPTVGCRRCGGGMAGNPFTSNVVWGAESAEKLPQDFVIMEGSGSTVPPVKTDTRIVIIGAKQPLDHILKYFGPYRIKTSDLVIVTMCEEPLATKEKIKKIEKGIVEIAPEIDYLLTIFRPKPLHDISSKKVFVATTAPDPILPKIKTHLEEDSNCEVVGITNNLSDRIELEKDLKDIEDAEVLLTEIKAASIDVAGMYARKKGLELTFMHNETVIVGGNVDDLEKAVLPLCKRAVEKRR